MNDNSSTPESSAARWLAILFGALITGSAGIVMAVYSVIVGEETAGGALLAASALAFGLLAANVDRAQRKRALPEDASAPWIAGADGHDRGMAVQRTSSAGAERMPAPLQASLANGGHSAHPGQTAVAQIEADPITGREREVLSLVAEGELKQTDQRSVGDIGAHREEPPHDHNDEAQGLRPHPRRRHGRPARMAGHLADRLPALPAYRTHVHRQRGRVTTGSWIPGTAARRPLRRPGVEIAW